MDEDTKQMQDRLYSTDDAAVWAEEWCKMARQIMADRGVTQENLNATMPTPVAEAFAAILDEGWMIGWFANAIETAKALQARANAAVEATTFERLVSPANDPDVPCLHPDFVATVEVGRLLPEGSDESDPTVPPNAYMAEIRVHCAVCDEPFRWTGVEAGQSPRGPMCSVDDLELRAPLRPATSDPDFGLSGTGFSIHYRDRRESGVDVSNPDDHGITRRLP